MPSGSLLARSLDAPAADLAVSYLAVQGRLDLLDKLEQRSAGTAADDRTVKIEAEMREWLGVYQEAIRRRGYINIAGPYVVNASSACSEFPSHWVQSMLAGRAGVLSIGQRGYLLDIGQHLKQGGPVLTSAGVIVESALALNDPSDADVRFIGGVGDGNVSLQPDVGVLVAAWPKDRPPPNRARLASCRIRLSSGQSLVPAMR